MRGTGLRRSLLVAVVLMLAAAGLAACADDAQHERKLVWSLSLIHI